MAFFGKSLAYEARVGTAVLFVLGFSDSRVFFLEETDWFEFTVSRERVKMQEKDKSTTRSGCLLFVSSLGMLIPLMHDLSWFSIVLIAYVFDR